MTQCRGIRGATTANDNTREAILEATQELLEGLVEKNQIDQESVAAAIFSTTPDLNAEFPAVAARTKLGWQNIALFNTHEMSVPNDAPKCIRVLLLVNTDKAPNELVNLYMRGAINLRARGTAQD
ncbi:chorismate mutase [SAR202 cluster bacterium AD-493-K16_JPT_193m]|mgnify:CR=1 FL=1|nr:chorismate mutase [SAR202 cluster bacterium AD-493-K16_JPT_193m]|tara:strand:+ start:1422 stop:1796 length:375 start_codon:yes stop_codon:yes gene_type:complete